MNADERGFDSLTERVPAQACFAVARTARLDLVAMLDLAYAPPFARQD